MAGRIWTYLLSVLLPISPMLCGQCSGSVRCQSLDSACCRALTTADTLPRRETCCQTKCPDSIESLSQNDAQRDVDLQSSTPAVPQRPQLPGRHEHCRSAICGQSAVTLRRIDWSIQGAHEPLWVDLPEWSIRIPLREPGQNTVFSFAANLHWDVNTGPSGRAARIAFCSWLI